MTTAGEGGGPIRCGIDEAASITGMSARILRDQATRGAIPGASKPAGRWLFVIADLRVWVARGSRAPHHDVEAARKARLGRAGRVAASGRTDTASAYELRFAAPAPAVERGALNILGRGRENHNIPNIGGFLRATALTFDLILT